MTHPNDLDALLLAAYDAALAAGRDDLAESIAALTEEEAR